MDSCVSQVCPGLCSLYRALWCVKLIRTLQRKSLEDRAAGGEVEKRYVVEWMVQVERQVVVSPCWRSKEALQLRRRPRLNRRGVRIRLCLRLRWSSERNKTAEVRGFLEQYGVLGLTREPLPIVINVRPMRSRGHVARAVACVRAQAVMMDTGYFEHHTSSEQVRLDIVSRCFAVVVVACQRGCDYWCEWRAATGHGRAVS